ncbi:hypothetical protein N7474_002462 [Penicillium riverlandense]|uniref:uncharacterized protein n=1 Tax=Penicillium riverlandense TaxID=1903569 RepID=UPI0025491797|nr:uncharacterized protein N7474_002462 [Penicillium riverlandense]KAJ5825324.1 hypothetical protein N7474_002462 [Penicillium riverlandense]
MAVHSFEKSLALKVIIFYALALITGATECYYPNGTPADGDVPCRGDGTASACCGPDAVCLTNGLCLAIEQPFGLSRGSCSDSTWQSDNCAQYCGMDYGPAGGAALVLFNSTGSDSYYCCNSVIAEDNAATCSNSMTGEPSTPFKVNNAELVPGVAALSNLVKKSKLSHIASHAAPQTEPTKHTTNSSTEELNSNNTTCDSNKDVAIGAGVGVPLGLLAIAFLVWALWERRRRMQAVAAALAAHKNADSHDLVRELPASIPARVELESVSGSCSRTDGSYHNGSYR